MLHGLAKYLVGTGLMTRYILEFFYIGITGLIKKDSFAAIMAIVMVRIHLVFAPIQDWYDVLIVRRPPTHYALSGHGILRHPA